MSACGAHPRGSGRERCAIVYRNLRGGVKSGINQYKYTKLGHLIVRKIIKIIATRCRIYFKAKILKFDSWCKRTFPLVRQKEFDTQPHVIVTGDILLENC